MCKQPQKATEQFHFIFERTKKRHKIALFVISKVNVPPFVSAAKEEKIPTEKGRKKEIFDSFFSLALVFSLS